VPTVAWSRCGGPRRAAARDRRPAPPARRWQPGLQPVHRRWTTLCEASGSEMMAQRPNASGWVSGSEAATRSSRPFSWTCAKPFCRSVG